MEITPNLKTSPMVPVLHCSSRILLVDDRPNPWKKQAALPPEIDKICGKSDFIFCKFRLRREKKGKPIQFGILYIIRLWLFEERTFKSWRMIKTPQCHTNLSITIYSLTLLINNSIDLRVFLSHCGFSVSPRTSVIPQRIPQESPKFAENCSSRLVNLRLDLCTGSNITHMVSCLWRLALFILHTQANPGGGEG